MRSKGFALILILVIIIAVLGVGFYLIKQNKSVLLPSPTPTIVNNTTADWKTYTNNNFQISFRYPSQAVIDDSSNKSVIEILPLGKGNENEFNSRISINYENKSETSDLYNVAKLDTDRVKQNCETAQISSISKNQINNLQAYFYKVNNDCGGYGNYTAYFVEFNKRIYFIDQNYNGSVTDQKNYKITQDQILSTFQFLK